MIIKFLSHASIIIYLDDLRILCDPWFAGDVFNDGWSLNPSSAMLTDDELRGITHLYISHEHPDHMHFPTLIGFSEEFKKKVCVIYQKNNSNKVVNALKKIGYCKFLLTKHMERINLSKKVFAYVYQHRHLDSALIIDNDGQVIINLNDAELSGTECQKLKKQFNNIAVLLTQFAIAGSEGIPEKDKIQAENVFVKMLDQAIAFQPKLIIPFASYVSFSKEDNSQVNKFVKNCFEAKSFLKGSGFIPWLLFPGSTINLNEMPRHDDEDLYAIHYKSNELTSKIVSEKIESIDLEKTIQNRIILWHSSYPRFFFRGIGAFIFYVVDINKIINVDFYKNKIACEDYYPGLTYNMQINSQPFYFAFKYDFGIQTLGVSGRYQIKPEDNSYNKWKYIRIISSLYNPDIYLHKTVKDNLKIMAWAFDRRKNIVENVMQQFKRFYK
ncbi:MBL fold metallo-hydrolase [Polynucleobacter sp. AP-Feld-500C-C5]|uniref:MBL fold metallo-hydrolase n=1 Tax=Polynucleobacter sp. AP-Feld-500C-C5 TaxID=2576924 RepID=UPI001C0AEB12|nr:MBL fold metallo-hydrolase [Polynucleobacter sp. AP-Feld-500C-C5]MBU3632897.1 MBL fold metallo-hydrolase [Polynucleobacter sp. AP-Feld-500C-C5]